MEVAKCVDMSGPHLPLHQTNGLHVIFHPLIRLSEYYEVPDRAIDRGKYPSPCVNHLYLTSTVGNGGEDVPHASRIL